MATLYIDRKILSMQSQRGILILKHEHGDSQRLPLRMIDHIVIHGRIDTDTGALGALADAGITVTLLSGRQGRRQATLINGMGKDAGRRLSQYRAALDPQRKTRIAACILKHKLANQHRMISRALTKRPDQRRPITKARRTLHELSARLQTPGAGLEQLRGLEGAAAAAYYDAYRRLFPASLGFQTRRRRPPPDPVNAALSLGYTLLHSDAVKIVHGAGLDPYTGYLHEPAHGRESLAADIIEPMRPKLDALIWWIFRKRVLTAEHFTIRDGACLLGKAGRGKYYAAYETLAAGTRRWMRRFVHGLIAHLQQDSGADAP